MYHIKVISPLFPDLCRSNEALMVDDLKDFKCWCEAGYTWDADDNMVPCLKWKISIKGMIFYELPYQPIIQLVHVPATV